VADKGIKEIYGQVIEEVRKDPQIQSLKRGRLYKVIQIILREEYSENQEKTQAICSPLGITPNSHEDDDYKVIKDLAETFFIDKQPFAENRNPLKKMISATLTQLRKIEQQLSDNNKVEFLLLAACVLVGVFFCIQYLAAKQRNTEQQQKPKQVGISPSPLSSPISVSAALCLIVPAKIVSSLQVGSVLSANEVEDLINNTSYFLCTTPEAANQNEQNLILTSDCISPDSQREVYLRIDINDSQDLIDKKTTYTLKTNLPDNENEEFIIKKLNCLKNLSGLAVFNRI